MRNLGYDLSGVTLGKITLQVSTDVRLQHECRLRFVGVIVGKITLIVSTGVRP